LKITFIRRNGSATGGAENYLIRLAGQLAARGHSSRLICESWKLGLESFAEVKLLPQKGPAWRRPVLFARAVRASLAGERGDLIFSLERGVPCDIYRAGDGVHRSWLQHRLKARPWRGRLQNFCNLKNPALCKLERFTFDPANTSRVIANSHLVQREVMQYFHYPEERIRVILNGVDFAHFSGGSRLAGREAMGWNSGEVVCLLVGAGAERKGHAAARRVLSGLRGRAHLHILDQPAPCPLPDLYAAADIFLFPTLYDPFANVTLEAMAAGLPVITTQDNGAAEIMQSGRNGFVVRDSRRIAEMTAHVRALLDPALRKQMGDAAQRSVQEYSLERNVRETLQLMEEVGQQSGENPTPR